MKAISQKYEKAVRESGFKRICGIDEAGRGAWAGPLVAAGVIFDENVSIKGLRDSKQLTQNMREQLFYEIQEKAIAWTIREVNPDIIDQVGVGRANELVIKEIVEELEPEFALIDKSWIYGLKTPHELIVKGDARVFSIAAASVLAKVHRDAVMTELDATYPGYNFAVNKGYGTKGHQAALDKLNYCAIHRQSYQPILQRKLL